MKTILIIAVILAVIAAIVIPITIVLGDEGESQVTYSLC